MELTTLLYCIYLLVVALPIFIVLTIITAVVAAIGTILGGERIFSYWPGKLWSQGTLALMLIPVTVKGQALIPRDRASVITPNHTSSLDIFLLYGYSGVRFKWVMKGALRKIPFVGWSCEKLGFIFVDSTLAGASQVVRDCEAAIDRGYHIFMFPEGSRTLTGHLGRLRKGAFKVAMETAAPIVPAKITGGYQILRRRGLFPKWGRLSLEFFPAIETAGGKTLEELMESVRARIA